MWCTACGKEIPEDSVFCQNCGAQLPVPVNLWPEAAQPTTVAAPEAPAHTPAPTAAPAPAPAPVLEPADRWELSAEPVFAAASEPVPAAPAPGVTLVAPATPDVASTGEPGPAVDSEPADLWWRAAPDAPAAFVPGLADEATPGPAAPEEFAPTVQEQAPTVRRQSTTVRKRPASARPWLESVEEEDGGQFDWGAGGDEKPERWHYLRWALIALVVVIVAAAAATAFLMLRDGSSKSGVGTTVTAKPATTSTAAFGAAGATSTTGSVGSTETSSAQVSSTETTGATTAGATSTTPIGGTDLVDLSSKATLRASSTLATSGSTNYAVANLVDGDPGTCWAEGVPGYGRGEWFEFKFATPVSVSEIKVLPGYDKKTTDYDRWFSNGRLKSFNLDFSDGSHKECTVKDARTTQTITFANPHTVTKIRVTIIDIYPATDAKNKAEDTSVSEFHVWGSE